MNPWTGGPTDWPVDRLREVHAALWPRYRDLVAEAYGDDGAVTGSFDRWARARGVEPGETAFASYARQYAYLRLVEAIGSPPVEDRGASTAGDHRPYLPDVPETGATRHLLATVSTEVDADRPIDPGTLSAGYEHLLSDEERSGLGQFYTPPPVARAVCRWAIPADDPPERVLDPAAGTGRFAVAAGERLAAVGVEAPLDRIVAVDVDPVALALTDIALSNAGDGSTGHPRAVRSSFFDLDPADLPGSGIGAIVGNPPFVRQEAISKDDVRAHLSAAGDGSGDADWANRLSARSDVYVYFVTQATRFLREGGRLGFVVPTKWLTTAYGESFRRFLFARYAVRGVVGFGARAFEDALVDTCLLLLEKRPEGAARRSNVVNFVTLSRRVTIEGVVDAIEADVPVPPGDHLAHRDADDHRVIGVGQGYLGADGPRKLAPYLDAPVEFVRLLDHPDLVPLSALGAVNRGVMTGANEFFFLDAGTEHARAIDDRFLAPAVKRFRDVEDRVLTRTDVDRFLFDAHGYVDQAIGDPGDPDGRSDPADAGPERRVKRALAGDGYDAALDYIERGESAGFHRRRSCASRRVWFDLGPLEPPDVLHPKFFHERAFAVMNRDGVVPGNAIDCVHLPDGVPAAAVLGVLDSTVGTALMECWGRTEGGGALQLMTYEVASRPVADVREFDAAERDRIAGAYRALLEDPSARDRLDRTVVDALGLDIGVDRLQDRYEEMVDARIGRGGPAAVVAGDDRSGAPGAADRHE